MNLMAEDNIKGCDNCVGGFVHVYSNPERALYYTVKCKVCYNITEPRKLTLRDFLNRF